MMSKQRNSHHSVETKLKTVLDVLENGTPVASAAKQLGVHRDTVYNWLNAYKKDGEAGLASSRSVRQPATSGVAKENRELKKRLKEKETEIEILKKF
ncbi:helix-turn-helix domain-containing protein, partial [Siminovitchia sediminis]